MVLHLPGPKTARKGPQTRRSCASTLAFNLFQTLNLHRHHVRLVFASSTRLKRRLIDTLFWTGRLLNPPHNCLTVSFARSDGIERTRGWLHLRLLLTTFCRLLVLDRCYGYVLAQRVRLPLYLSRSAISRRATQYPPAVPFTPSHIFPSPQESSSHHGRRNWNRISSRAERTLRLVVMLRCSIIRVRKAIEKAAGLEKEFGIKSKAYKVPGEYRSFECRLGD